MDQELDYEERRRKTAEEAKHRKHEEILAFLENQTNSAYGYRSSN